MATIETRKSKKTGKVTCYRVKWRIGGTGRWDGEPFDGYTEAKRFKGLVEAYDHHRPPADVLVARGFEYLIPKGFVPAPPPNLEPQPTDEPADAMPTFSEYAEKFIDNLDHALGYTKGRYRRNLHNHVTPIFGGLPIDKVEYETLQDWQRKMVKKGLSVKTIQNIRGSVIFPVLAAATKPQGRKPALIASNPADGLKLPQGAGRKKRRDIIISEADLELYIRCAYEVDPEAGDLLMVAIATGMRWGDLTGLCKRDIDLEAAEIRPRQVLARSSEEHNRWELREYTKSIAGDERVIPIPPGIVELLRRRVAALRPDALVLTAPRGGPWDHSSFRERRYLPILKLAQQRGLAQHITPHGLRHSLLTKLADAGTDPKVIQHMAGHETITTTYNTYIRPTKAQRQKAADTVGTFIAGALPKAT